MGLAFASLCNETVFYEKEKKCCKLCPRGKFVKNDCTADLETDCRDCPENSFSDSIDRLKECSPCHECQQVFTSKCNQTANAKCSCHPGFLCSNLDCTKCEQKKCSKGEEVKRTGSIEYTYKCVVCPNNTYSDTEEGPCKPLTRCEASGYVPIFPGNKTHNAQCGLHANSPTISVSVAPQDVCGCPLSKEESVGQHIQPTESDNYSNQSLLSTESNCFV
ncbi:tumor necrosis factor receptor superfamily member 18 isoform X3 [Esox lucius]|uniref:tumor necrosis factor receptor superfamily member 18 isoform X3 n=1 Tax=Esox lucius TaxID=8010 RepID=UPI000661B78E|nr:tumor necrosis factor receptor superfamily member 18 isoform X3 [Esox lucius]